MYKLIKNVAAASVLLLVAAIPARADLIVNGGFEDPALASGSWALYGSITGWDLVDGLGAIEVQNNVAGTPYEGSQFVELDSTRPSTIFQEVNTEAGEDYILSFAFAARPGTSIPNDNFMRVMWDGSEVFAAAAPDYTPNWTVFSIHVTATSTQTLLSFGDISLNTQNSFGVYLDAVSLVKKVPEPGTLGLLGLGLLGIGLGRRRARH